MKACRAELLMDVAPALGSILLDVLLEFIFTLDRAQAWPSRKSRFAKGKWHCRFRAAMRDFAPLVSEIDKRQWVTLERVTYCRVSVPLRGEGAWYRRI
jgi:hypothetical protein